MSDHEHESNDDEPTPMERAMGVAGESGRAERNGREHDLPIDSTRRLATKIDDALGVTGSSLTYPGEYRAEIDADPKLDADEVPHRRRVLTLADLDDIADEEPGNDGG